MDTPTQNAGAGTPVVQASGMSGRTKTLMLIGVLLIIAAAVVYFGPNYGIDIGKFFAAEPAPLGTPVTGVVGARLYPVFDQTASKVQFVLEPGDLEITGFQFRATVTGAEFDMSGFIGRTVFSTVLEAAHLLADGTLSFAAGVSAGAVGATSTMTVAAIDYIVPASLVATDTLPCVTIDMANTIVTAKGVNTNVLDMGLSGWSNRACVSASAKVPTVDAFTATPASITSGQSTVLSWTVSNASGISIDHGVVINDPQVTSVSVSPATTTTYTLTATGPGGSAMATVTVTIAQPTTTVLAPIRGDVNGDRVVDISDFNIVVANFGKVPSSIVLGDENGDGKIDIIDFNAVVTFFGTLTVEATTPL